MIGHEGEEGQRHDEQRRHHDLDRRPEMRGEKNVGRDRQGECCGERAAQRRGNQRSGGDGEQEHDRLDDRELVDLAPAAADQREIDPAEPADEMRDQEIAPRHFDVEARRVGAVGVASDQRQRRIAGERNQRPGEDFVLHAGVESGDRDRQHHDRNGDGDVGHRARVELQQLAVESRVAGLVGELVARLPDRARHVAVAVRFPAVHNDLVRRVRT